MSESNNHEEMLEIITRISKWAGSDAQADLRKREGVAERALEFTILTAGRTGEVVGARWSEIDLETRTWVPTTPDEAVLDRVPNPHSDMAYAVRFSAPEFTVLCAVTAQPDFAIL